MKKFGLSIVTVISFLLLQSSANAMTLDPSSGSYEPNSSVNIPIVASPPGTSNTVQMRLTISNATIIGYTAPSGAWLSIGVCDGAAFYTAQTICVDLAKSSGNITAGESLGTIQISVDGNTANVWTISGDSDNGYLIDGTPPSLSVQSGILGTYQYAIANNPGGTNPLPTQLPNTAIEFDDASFMLIVGAFFVVAGLLAYQLRIGESVVSALLYKSGISKVKIENDSKINNSSYEKSINNHIHENKHK